MAFKFLICLAINLVIVLGSEKKGVVHWADRYLCEDFKVLNNMTWWYDHRMSLSYFHDKKICSSTIDNYKDKYVPMVWDYKSMTKGDIPDEAKFILGFNEPNHKHQSNMTPQKAAIEWKILETKSNGKPLVSPSAAVCGANCISDEISWFDDFFELCKDCRVDYLAVHTYWCNANKVMRHLKYLNEKFGKKIWLTEFACSETPYEEEQLDFMKAILPQLEKAGYVFRYSWYSARIKSDSDFVKSSASLLQRDSSTLTPLGEYYNNFQGPEQDTSGNDDDTEEGEDEVDEDPDIVGRDETVLILKSYTSNPTKWWKIINFLKKNSNTLSEAVQSIYMASSKKTLKKRIKPKFKEIMCTDVDAIPDQEIRELVEKIRNMPKDESAKKSGRLRVPKCSKRKSV